jgi:hypothetical protein
MAASITCLTIAIQTFGDRGQIDMPPCGAGEMQVRIRAGNLKLPCVRFIRQSSGTEGPKAPMGNTRRPLEQKGHQDKPTPLGKYLTRWNVWFEVV